ncbi:tryptophan synthase beta subunit-like PLP-dependent enzyme [Blyttiomyces helicus]|uniref:Tryptophan synthase beta subunit-like PLP-dependent enzyme n=1 Tax=Blyttiomyces helicus TaxID=388810 RepID=A0A4V1IPX1_9FUNG|nr:tryptophan synthase beta subunit-like PLP-dependent enzyme [Blyttiomyces helicus]|eukprot:RKO84537.1 tryptophan synthase beta subunit-like PLP-dependent enzyme [Blyttiomyces helicus]
MRYRSTRGYPFSPPLSAKQGISFEDAVLQGLAPDGGLFIPESIPAFPLQEILSWSDLPFPALAFRVFRKFIAKAEIPDADLESILLRSFATFSSPAVTPLEKLPNVRPTHPNRDLENLYLLELFHGPTFAFKDVALQVLGNLFAFFLERRNANRARKGLPPYAITVVGATSGDTGGAAIYGLRGKAHVNCFILHPKGRISPVQEQQMTSVLDANVHNVAVEGTFDDCQDIVKALFSDAAFRDRYHLAAINSINWARILAQTSYYFYSHLALLKRIGVPRGSVGAAALVRVRYCVPTGNFGDVLAGYYALRMGLPIEQLVVATNENDILHRFLESGSYEKNPAADGEVKQTLSPAMDILISSNFERLAWYLARGDGRGAASAGDDRAASAAVAGWMAQLKATGGFAVPAAVHGRAREAFGSVRVSDADTTDAIHRYYHHGFARADGDAAKTGRGHHRVLDPHTAVGVVAGERFILAAGSGGAGSAVHTICLSTASPGKFPEAVLGAINANVPPVSVQRGFVPLAFEDFAPKQLVELAGLPRRCIYVQTGAGGKAAGLAGVRTVIEGLIGKDFAEPGKPIAKL